MKLFFTVVGLLLTITIGACIVRLVLLPVWFANRSIDVAQQQLDPAELLRKYEWFKDASAQLDKKHADIGIYNERITALDKRYGTKELPRTIAEQEMIWQQELAGVKASYNSLAAEYNAQMAKINWRFCNRGDLPAGAPEPLPREYKPYTTE